MGWTAERDETLRQMARAGHSSHEVAERLGTTRGSVLGRARRIRVRFAKPLPTQIFNRRGRTIYAAGHGDEEIRRGTNKENLIAEVADILNDDLPEGEPRYTLKEVSRMVRPVL